MRNLLSGVDQMVLNNFLKHLTEWMGLVTPEEAQTAKNYVLGILEQTHRIVVAIEPEDVQRIVSTLSQLDGARINEFINATTSIETKLNDLHEIKIAI